MRTMLLGASLVFVGCGGDGLKEAGIWAMYLPADTTIDCTDEITHNFTDAYVLEDEVVDAGDWTITEELNVSDSLTFVQVEELGDGEAILFLGNAAYPGIETANGWKFSWDSSEDSVTTEDHASGYSYAATIQGTSSLVINFQVDGETAKGTVTSTTDSTRIWTESDEWELKELGFDRGQMPVGAYLVRDTLDGKGTISANNTTNAECGGDCSLQVTSTCSGEGRFTAKQLQYDDESVYEYLDESGQTAGL